jgi:hypothetical protein
MNNTQQQPIDKTLKAPLKESKSEELTRVPIETIRAYYGLQFISKPRVPATLVV